MNIAIKDIATSSTAAVDTAIIILDDSCPGSEWKDYDAYHV